jgi:glycerol uptake facilitator-like aquaporin
MNLPLHTGLLGALEACLIAFLIGVLVYALWAWVCRRTGLTVAHAVGWGAAIAVLLAAGLDSWNLFYLGISRLESPLYARLALAGIHDPDFLGVRVLLQIIGAMTGTVAGWWLFSHRLAGEHRARPVDAPADADEAADRTAD